MTFLILGRFFEKDMSQFRANSSPDLDFPGTSKDQRYDDLALQGVAANVKLLLKLIQDHQLACDQDKTDHRRMLRVATMMTILDNAKERIQKCQSFGLKKPESELKRCNTEVRREADDERERLRRELTSSLASQKNLKAMCSSLGKEKQIMEAELSKKVHELSEMEELMNNLKAQNETLRQKVQECLSGGGAGESQLQERNKALSEQVVRSLDGYRSMKKKLKIAEAENAKLHSTVDEVGDRVVKSLERVRSLKERIASSSPLNIESSLDIQEEIVLLETMFECFVMILQKHDDKQSECAQISAYKPSLLAQGLRTKGF